MKHHIISLCILLISCSMLACGDLETPPLHSPNNHNNTFDIGDKDDAGDLLDIVEPPEDIEEDVEKDTSTEPDTDTGQPPTTRTLKDYRLCENDNDCPVNMGSCLKEVTLNRIDSSGTRTLALSNLFPETLQPHQGVCTLSCTESPNVCASLSLNGLQSDQAPHTCQLIAVGESPYPDNAIDFPLHGLEPREQAAGQAFAAICRPPVELHPELDSAFCSPCDSQHECGDQGAICWSLLHKAPLQDGQTGGSCLSACENDSQCPMGFVCDATANNLNDSNGQSYCRPVLDTCTNCRDLDQDGFGTGYCGTATHPVTPHDCDDSNPLAYFDPLNMNHPFPTYCGQHDYNCNGISDDMEQIGSREFSNSHCSACNDSCSGDAPNGHSACENTNTLNDPVYTCKLSCDRDQNGKLLFENCDGDPATGCEVSVTDESNIYYRDLDGDGFGDPTKPIFACTAGEIPDGYVANGDDCDDSNPDVYPGAPELCDGLDNNCNGAIDENIVDEGEDCTTTSHLAECKVGTKVCLGSEGMRCVPNNTFDWYLDDDQDGFGDQHAAPIASCEAPQTVPITYYVRNNADCNDQDPTLNPDTRWYPDRDGDSFGDQHATPDEVITSCEQPPPTATFGYVKNNQDCNDDDPRFKPNAEQLCGVDNLCTGNTAHEKTFGGNTIHAACNSNQPGICQAGVWTCSDNKEQITCVANKQPQAEICDGLDNSCNGKIDDGCPKVDNLQRQAGNTSQTAIKLKGTVTDNENLVCEGTNSVWTKIRIKQNKKARMIQSLDVGCQDLNVKHGASTPYQYTVGHRTTQIDSNYLLGPSAMPTDVIHTTACEAGKAIYKIEAFQKNDQALYGLRFHCRAYKVATTSAPNKPVTSTLTIDNVNNYTSEYFGEQAHQPVVAQCPEGEVAYGAKMEAGEFKSTGDKHSLLTISLHCAPMSMLTR